MSITDRVYLFVDLQDEVTLPFDPTIIFRLQERYKMVIEYGKVTRLHVMMYITYGPSP